MEEAGDPHDEQGCSAECVHKRSDDGESTSNKEYGTSAFFIAETPEDWGDDELSETENSN